MNLLLLLIPTSVFCMPRFDGISKKLRSTSPFELNNRLGVSQYLFQGDIDLTEEQRQEMELNENGRSKRQAWTGARKWANNTVYYYIEDDVSIDNHFSVFFATVNIQAQTCIDFVENRTAENRIRIYNGDGCHSHFGMLGGEQNLSLSNGCASEGTAAHEFAHALGFEHTQARSDRDDFITIHKENVEEKFAFTLDKLKPINNILYTPYEYGSMMHYAAVGFSTNPAIFTITPKDERYLHTMGSSRISFYDILMINKHYGCDANCPTENPCKNGGYPNPRNCSECNCPDGYGGDLCDRKPSFCGETFVATSDWQVGTIEVGEKSNREPFLAYMTCDHWITAPEGKKIEVQIIEIFNEMCDYGCEFSGIEIKTEKNTRIRNPVICCKEFEKKVLTSFLNPTPIISYSRFYSRFDIAYRYKDEDQPAAATITTPTKGSTTSTPSTVQISSAPTTTNASCVDVLGYSCSIYVEHMGGCNKIKEFERKFCAKTCGYCKKRECPKYQYMLDGKCVRHDNLDVYLA